MELRILLLLASFIFVSGCGSDGGAATQHNTNSGRTAASPGPDSSVSNNTERDREPAATEATNANEVTPIERMRQRRAETLREVPLDPNQPVPTIEETLQRSTRPAPENSEFSVALTEILFERRTFRAHPVIDKVEKITKDGKVNVTLFLKDGRKVGLPEGSIENLSTISTSAILGAAGLPVQTQRPAERKPGGAPVN